MGNENNQKTGSEQSEANENHAKGVCSIDVCDQPHLKCYNCLRSKHTIRKIKKSDVGVLVCSICCETVYYYAYGCTCSDDNCRHPDELVPRCKCVNTEYKVVE